MAREARDVWAKRVERWRDSGLTAREYAAEIGVNHNTLQHWGWKLAGGSKATATVRKKSAKRRRRSRQPSNSVPVVEVVGAQGTGAEPSGYEVVLQSGVTVRIPATFDDASLGRLLAVLEAR